MKKNPDEISIGEIMHALYQSRLLVIGFALVFGGIAAAIAFVIPAKFESTAVLSPVTEDSTSGRLGSAGELISQFGGVVGLGGISLSGSVKRSEAIATLQSNVLIETFIAENNLLPILYEKKWDSDRNSWRESAQKDPPTLWKACEMFRKQISKIVEDKKTGLVTLTITWTDPRLAAAWAADLVKRTNSLMRQRTITESTRNLDYYNAQLSKTSVVELQKAIYSVIEAETKRVLIAQGNSDYAFRTIDPPQVAEKKKSPARMLIIAMGLAFGVIAASLFVLTRNTWRLSTRNLDTST